MARFWCGSIDTFVSSMVLLTLAAVAPFHSYAKEPPPEKAHSSVGVPHLPDSSANTLSNNPIELSVQTQVWGGVTGPSGIDLAAYDAIRYVSVTTGSDEAGDGSYTKPWASILQAHETIDDANEFKVYAILVSMGTYSGATIETEPWVHLYGGFDPFDWSRDIDRNETILDGEDQRRVVIASDNVILDGFTITNGYTLHGGAGVLYDGVEDGTLSNCFITGNSAESGGGISCSYSSPEFLRCTFANNSAAKVGGAISFYECEHPALISCTIAGNSTGYNGGAVYCNRSNPSLTNCILWNPGREIVEQSSSSPSATFCCIQGGRTGTGNIDSYPRFLDPYHGIWRLQNGSPCIDSGTDTGTAFNGEAPEIGSWEAPEYYNPSPIEPIPKRVFVNRSAPPDGDGLTWETAFQTVSEALFVYFVSNEVWVAGGEYNENLYLEDTVSLYGGFGGWETAIDQRDLTANPTILDAVGLNTRVITIDRIDGTTLDGFTIQGGSTTQPGGGIHYDSVNSATLVNCSIVNNHSSGQEGGGGGVHYDRSQGFMAKCLLRNNSGRVGGAVASNISDVTLTDCVIDSNLADVRGGGVYLRSSFGPLINCVIQNNSSLISGGGVSCDRSDPRIARCIISENTAVERGGGVYCSDGADPEIVHCTIVGNSAEFDGGAVYTFDSDPTITNCILWNPGDEIILGFSFRRSFPPVTTFSCVQGGFKGEGNIESYPRFVDTANGDWRLQDGSPCIDRARVTGTDFNGTAPEMGAWEAPESYTQGGLEPLVGRFYVNHEASPGGDGLSWETAFRSISESLSLYTDPNEIWIAGGTYREALRMERGVSLYGGFDGSESLRNQRRWKSNPTILDAKSSGERVVTVNKIPGVRLDGLTLTGGKADNGWSGPGLRGGGVYYNEVASATLAHCDIVGNSAIGEGGGVYGRIANLTLIDCRITENSSDGGGGVYSDISAPTILNCTLTNNSARYGGGQFCLYSDVVLRNCVIADNSVTDRGGGFYIDKSNPELTNCLIAENVALETGGAVFINGSDDATFENCTLAGNMATNGGAGFMSFGSSPKLSNCILWNSTDEIVVETGEGPMMKFSCVRGGYEGESIIEADPLFTDGENGDYRLLPNSPCVDRGNPDPAFYDGCRPPGQGQALNDIGYTGGPENCEIPDDSPTPTPTPTGTLTTTPTPVVTPISNFDFDRNNRVDAIDLLMVLQDESFDGESCFEFSFDWHLGTR